MNQFEQLILSANRMNQFEELTGPKHNKTTLGSFVARVGQSWGWYKGM